MTHTRRKLLATVGTVGGIAIAGCLGDGSSEDSPDSPETETTMETATETEMETSSPESEYSYATKGNGDESVVTYIGNWKCPVCKRFSTGPMQKIFTDYVEPGKLSLRFRALAYKLGTETPWLGPDAPRAARAGLVVWNIEPESYWPYHEHVFENQPPESDTWATTDRLVEFASAAGVEQTEKLKTQIEAGKYEAPVKQTTVFAEEVGLRGTPSLLIDGELVNPIGDTEKTWSMLDELSKNTDG